jgi:hypothetical protein
MYCYFVDWFHSCVLHRDLCERSNFTVESTCLMAVNVRNEGKQLTRGYLDNVRFHSERWDSCVGICL